MRVDAAWALIYYSIDCLDHGYPVGMLSSSTKVFASDFVTQVPTDVVQVLGYYGLMHEYPVEKLMRDIRLFSIFEGTDYIERMVCASELSEKAPPQNNPTRCGAKQLPECAAFLLQD